MQLYHGSPVSGITELRPFPSNHDRAYAYLTDRPALAMIYAYNPIRRPGGFFPYWLDKEGALHYDEYFPGQLLLYKGQGGWVYQADTEALPRLDKMPWVYLSESPVPVTDAVYIPDLYEALLQAETAGRLIIHRFEDIPPKQQERHRQIVRQSLEGHSEDDYVRFIRQHMPELF